MEDSRKKRELNANDLDDIAGGYIYTDGIEPGAPGADVSMISI